MKLDFTKKIITLLCLSFFSLMSCGGGSDPKPDPIVLEVSNISLLDVSNFGDGRDLQVSFTEITSSELLEYRVIVVKENNAATFDLSKALSLTVENYTAILPSSYESNFTLSRETLDSDGELIKNEISYVIFVLSIAKSDNALSGINSSSAITLKEILIEIKVPSVQVSDVGNFGDGRDLKVTFNEVENPDLEEYRIIVVKENNASAFSLEIAQNLDEGNYIKVLPNSSSSSFILEETSTDANGDLIIEGNSYVVFVATIIDEESLGFKGGVVSSSAITLSLTNLVTSVESEFSASGGIVVGTDGSIYIADFGTGASNGTTILKFKPNGEFERTFASGLLGPTGGAFDSKGNLYWSSYSASKVHKIDAAGNVSDFVNIPGPVAIAVDHLDNLFIASCDGNDIKKVTPEGVVTTFATSSSFRCINGLAITETGVLYGCNFEGGNVFKIDTDGTVSNFANISGGVNMKYRDGLLYVTGRNAHRIYTVDTATGEVITLAGTGERGNKDGSAMDAEFSFPNGLGFSLDGLKLYVNDVDPNSGTNANGVNFNPNILRVIELVE